MFHFSAAYYETTAKRGYSNKCPQYAAWALKEKLLLDLSMLSVKKMLTYPSDQSLKYHFTYREFQELRLIHNRYLTNNRNDEDLKQLYHILFLKNISVCLFSGFSLTAHYILLKAMKMIEVGNKYYCCEKESRVKVNILWLV